MEKRLLPGPREIDLTIVQSQYVPRKVEAALTSVTGDLDSEEAPCHPSSPRLPSVGQKQTLTVHAGVEGSRVAACDLRHSWGRLSG